MLFTCDQFQKTLIPSKGNFLFSYVPTHSLFPSMSYNTCNKTPEAGYSLWVQRLKVSEPMFCPLSEGDKRKKNHNPGKQETVKRKKRRRLKLKWIPCSSLCTTRVLRDLTLSLSRLSHISPCYKPNAKQ